MARIAIKSSPGKLKVTIPRRAHVILQVLFPLIALIYIRGAIRGPRASFWLVMYAAAMWCYAWIMGLIWKEVVLFTPSTLEHGDGPFGFSRKVKYEMAKIREPRFVEPRPGRAGLPTGLEFFYERVAHQVLDGISEEQAKEIIAAVVRQFPELAPVWGTLHGYWSGDNAGADFREN